MAGDSPSLRRAARVSTTSTTRFSVPGLGPGPVSVKTVSSYTTITAERSQTTTSPSSSQPTSSALSSTTRPSSSSSSAASSTSSSLSSTSGAPLAGGNSGQSTSHHGLSGGAIAAAVIVPILAVIALALLAFFLLKRRRQRQEDAEDSSDEGGGKVTPMAQASKGPAATALEKETASFGANTPPPTAGRAAPSGALPAAAVAAAAAPLASPPRFKRKEVGSPASNVRSSSGAPILPKSLVEPSSPLLETPAAKEPFKDRGSTGPSPSTMASFDDGSPKFNTSTTDTTPTKPDELFIGNAPTGRHWHSTQGTSPRLPKDPRKSRSMHTRDESEISDLDDDAEIGEVEIKQAAPVTRQRASVIDMEMPVTPPKEKDPEV